MRFLHRVSYNILCINCIAAREEHVGGTHPNLYRGTRPFWFFDFFILVDPPFCKRDPNAYPYIA